jgi:hypothetical protein
VAVAAVAVAVRIVVAAVVAAVLRLPRWARVIVIVVAIPVSGT